MMRTKRPLSPDYNLYLQDRSKGLRVGRTSLPPSARPKKPSRTVDIEHLVGTEIELTIAAACNLLGPVRPSMKFLMKVGLMGFTSGHDGPSKRYVRMDPGTTLRTLFTVWAANMPVPMTHREFSTYKRVLRICHFSADFVDHPRQVYEGLARQARLLGAVNPIELSAFIPMNSTSRKTITERVRTIVSGKNRRREAMPRGAFVSPEALVQAFPLLVHARGTCFATGSDPSADDASDEAEDGRPRPNASVLSRIWEMGPLAGPAALFAGIVGSTIRGKNWARQIVGSLSEFDKAFAELHPGQQVRSPDALLRTYELFAYGRGDAASLSDDKRMRICNDTLLAARVVQSYIRHVDADGGLGLAELALGQPSEERKLRKLVRHRLRRVVKLGLTGRKRRSDRASDDLLAIEAAAASRMEQIVATSDVLRSAARDLDQRQFVDQPVYAAALDAKGNALGGLQRAVWRVWREDALCEDLEKSFKYDKVLAKRLAETGSNSRASRTYYEFLRVEPAAGTDAPEPWFVTVFRHGALIAPAELPHRLQRRRQRMMARWRLPTLQHVPGGLLSFEDRGGALWRKLAELRRVLVPVEEFELAMRFAHLGFRCVMESFCRTNEFMQITQWRDDWPKCDVGGGTHVSFLAIPKVKRGTSPPFERVQFPVSDDTLSESFELAERVCERCGHAGGLLPLVLTQPPILWKVPDPQPFVFSYDGASLTNTALNRFLQFLLAGRGRFTFHDFRHAVANSARADGMLEGLLMVALNHVHLPTTRRYSRPTRRQENRLAEGAEDHLVRRIARVRAKREKEKEKA